MKNAVFLVFGRKVCKINNAYFLDGEDITMNEHMKAVYYLRHEGYLDNGEEVVSAFLFNGENPI